MEDADKARESAEESRQAHRSIDTLQAERDLLSAVLDTAGALVVVLDHQGRIVRFNRACEQTTGYRFEEVRRLPVWDFLLLPEETEAVKRVFEELRAGLFPNTHENVWMAKGGARRVIAWSNTALTDAEGRVEYVVATGLDVTERKQAEEALRKAHSELELRVQEQIAELATANAALKGEIVERVKAEQALRIKDCAIESSGNAIAISAPDGSLTYVNPAFLELWGYEAGGVLGKPAVEFWAAEEKAAQVIQTLHEKGNWSGELVAQKRGGSTADIQVSASMIRDEAGRPIGMMAYFVDVTEQRQQEEALRASEEKLRTISDSALDAVVMMDPAGKVAHWNRAAERMFGYRHEEIMGRNVHHTLVPDRYRQRAEKGLREFAGSGHGPTVGKVFVLEALRKDGSEFPIEISVSPIRLQGGWWAVAVLRDITERKRAEQAIKEEQRLLRQMLDLHERERKLMSYEIHDGLAQLVTGALLNFQAFNQSREEKPEEAQKLFERGHQFLSESIAETRRLISGLRPPILDESGVVAAIDYLVCESMQDSGVETEFSHNVDFDRLAPPLESALFRVAQETLTNAIRHSKTDKVRIELVQSGDQVRLEVRDWGIGFDPAAVGEDCFGLRGIRERASLLGGNARIESPAEGGTRIVLKLPLVQDAR